MDGTDNIYILFGISSIQQMYHSLFFWNFEKKHLGLIQDTIENKIYQNNWETVFLNRLNLCWDKIYTCALILQSIFCILYVFHTTDEHFIV